MSRLAATFKPGHNGFDKAHHKALIGYVTVGYPSLEATMKVVPLLAESGCDIVELGIPFSDPLADGVTIQKASFRSLQDGVTPQVCLDTARKLREKVDIPLVFMTYFNPVLSYGPDEFCSACNGAGIDGLIIPDLPPEEGATLQESTEHCNLDLIYLLAPTSTESRIRLVADNSRGFIYLVSVTGVTGARTQLSADLTEFVNRVRKVARQPLCVGFGISTPAQAKEIARFADGIIVGSRIIQLMEEDASLAAVKDFVKGLRKALDEVR